MYPVRDDVFRLIPWAVYQEEVFQDHTDNFAERATERENKDRMAQYNEFIKSDVHVKDIKEILSLHLSRQHDCKDSSCLRSEPRRTPQPNSPDNPNQLHSFEHKMSPVFPLPSVPQVLEEEEAGTRSASVITAMVERQVRVAIMSHIATLGPEERNIL